MQLNLFTIKCYKDYYGTIWKKSLHWGIKICRLKAQVNYHTLFRAYFYRWLAWFHSLLLEFQVFDAHESFASLDGTSSNYSGFPKEMPEINFWPCFPFLCLVHGQVLNTHVLGYADAFAWLSTCLRAHSMVYLQKKRSFFGGKSAQILCVIRSKDMQNMETPFMVSRAWTFSELVSPRM